MRRGVFGSACYCCFAIAPASGLSHLPPLCLHAPAEEAPAPCIMAARVGSRGVDASISLHSRVAMSYPLHTGVAPQAFSRQASIALATWFGLPARHLTNIGVLHASPSPPHRPTDRSGRKANWITGRPDAQLQPACLPARPATARCEGASGCIGSAWSSSAACSAGASSPASAAGPVRPVTAWPFG